MVILAYGNICHSNVSAECRTLKMARNIKYWLAKETHSLCCVRCGVNGCPLVACLYFWQYQQSLGLRPGEKECVKFLHVKFAGQVRGDHVCVSRSKVVFSKNITILKVFYLHLCVKQFTKSFFPNSKLIINNVMLVALE